MESTKNYVYRVTSSILNKINNTKETSKTKALLANIRNSVDKDMSDNIETMAYIFSNVPEDYLGHNDELSHMEVATITAVQLYAIHQQGNTLSVYENRDDKLNIGDALSTLRGGESESIDRRFNVMITSSNFKELKHHLRQLIKILKTKSDAKVDYAKLAADLYCYLAGNKDGVKLSWSRSYYKFRKNEKMEGEIQNEE